MAALRFAVGICILLAVKNVKCGVVRSYTDYAGLECDIANNLIAFMQTTYGIVKYNSMASPTQDEATLTATLQPVVEIFNNTQPYIAKALHILFYQLDNKLEMRTGDTGLIKALLATNLFMIYSKRNSINIISSLNDYVNRLYNIIERFWLKSCKGYDGYNNYQKIMMSMSGNQLTTEYIETLLNTALKPLTNILDTLTFTIPETFSSNVYNANSLLLWNDDDVNIWNYVNWELTNVFKQLTEDTTSDSSQTFYDNNISAIVNINDLFIAQNVLFKITSDLFVRRAYNLLNTTPLDKKKLGNFLINLNEFIDTFMPNGCLTTECNSVTFIQDALNTIMFNTDETQTVLSTILGQKNSLFNQTLWNQILDDITVENFVSKIMNNFYLKFFRQVRKILSYESNANFIYSTTLHWWDNNGKRVNNNYINYYANETMTIGPDTYYMKLNAFRKNLLMFYFCFEHYKSDTTEDDNNLDIQDVMFEVKQMYQYFSTFNYVQNKIMLPLLYILTQIHYKISNDENENHDGVEELFLVTVNAVENYMFNTYTCKVPSNLSIYMKQLVNDEGNLEYNNWYTILSKGEVSSDDQTNFDNFFNDLYNSNWLRKDLFQDYNTRNLLKFNWNGSPQMTASQVFNKWSSSLLNWLDIIQYRWFVIKWAVAELLVDIHLLLESSKYSITEIENALVTQIQNIKSVSVQQFMKNIFKAVKKYKSNLAVVNYVIDDSLSSLGVDEEAKNSAYEALNGSDASQRIIADVKFLLLVFSKIAEENNSILDLETINFTTTLLPISPKQFNTYVKKCISPDDPQNGDPQNDDPQN